MAHEMITKRMQKQPNGKVHELLKNHSAEGLDKVNVKRDRFLTHLKNQYGYANEEAEFELERLLRQFYGINRSYNMNRIRLRLKHSPRE